MHKCVCVCVCARACACTRARSVAQLCPTLSIPMDWGPPGSSVHGIFQLRTLAWTAISYSRGSSWHRVWTWISGVSCIGRWILYHWATWEAQLLCMQFTNYSIWILIKMNYSFFTNFIWYLEQIESFMRDLLKNPKYKFLGSQEDLG